MSAERHVRPPEPPGVSCRGVLLVVAGVGGLVALALVLSAGLLGLAGADLAGPGRPTAVGVPLRGLLSEEWERQDAGTSRDAAAAIPRALSATAERSNPYGPLSEAEIERFRRSLPHADPDADGEARP